MTPRLKPRPRALPLLGLLAAAALLLSIQAARSGSSGPPAAFEGARSLEAATERAAATGRPVLVFATASWCPPCQQLKRGALSDPAVVEWVRSNTEPVYLDIDEDRDGALALGVTSIPTLVVLRGGTIEAVHRGAVAADALLAWLKSSTGG